MWLLDVRSPRSDAECRGGDRHGAFIQTQGNCMSVRSLGVNMGFTQPLEALVLTRFVAFMDPATALIGSAAKIAGSLLTLRKLIACLGWYSLYTCEVVFADCSREHFAGDETN